MRVLRRAGCEVSFDARQTCCGQPAFNAGHRAEARRVARGLLEVYAQDASDAIVLPSGSCCAMIKRLPELFAGEPELARQAERVAARTHELGSFLVNELGVHAPEAAIPLEPFFARLAPLCVPLREGMHDLLRVSRA